MANFFKLTVLVALLSGLGWLLYRFVTPDWAFASLPPAFLFLLVLHISSARVRAREFAEFANNVEELREAGKAMRAAFADTKKNLAGIAMALANKTQSHERRVESEMRILEDQIRHFSNSLAAPVLPQNYAIAQSGNAVFANTGTSGAQMLETVRRALEDNRVDLYLQPVVTLPQRKVKFYEVLSRLRSEDGAIIMPEEFIKVAAPAGLMSVVDNLLLFRCVQIVRRLTHRNRELGVFCNISGHTLRDAEFFPQFLDFMHHHKTLAPHIIFEFTQDTIASAGPAEEGNLRYLSGLGFRFSMDQVARLDFDAAHLKQLGFHFIKLKADVLISGMNQANARIAAEDLKDMLFRNGIDLVVERIEGEKTVVQLLDYNVAFGQGYLFGEPRPVRETGGEPAEAEEGQKIGGSVTVLSPNLTRRLAG